MNEKNLSAEIAFVKENKAELLQEYRNKFLLIHGQEVIGSYDTYAAAGTEGVRLFGVDGIFLVQEMLDKDPVNLITGALL